MSWASGLSGSSLALALGEHDWLVTGTDLDPTITEAALLGGVIVGSELADATSLVIVC